MNPPPLWIDQCRAARRIAVGAQNRPADGGAEAGPKPASAPTGKARRLRGGDAAADRKTRTDGTN